MSIGSARLDVGEGVSTGIWMNDGLEWGVPHLEQSCMACRAWRARI